VITILTPELMKFIRLTHGLSQKEFAERLQLSRPLVTLIERKERTITKNTVRKVMKVFNLNTQKLNEINQLREMIGK
jgi:transcriptional regulator with XRE-family HTH domain